MKTRVLLLIRLLLVAVSYHTACAFREAMGKRRRGYNSFDCDNINKRTTTVGGRTDDTLSVTNACTNPNNVRSQLPALYASRQFRDVEEMLDSFHEEMVLINFMALNCGPCKLQKKELASVGRAVGKSLHMLAIDTNRWPDVSSRFEVGKLPCLVALRNGQVLFRIEGYTKAEDVVAQLQSAQQQQEHRFR